MTFTFAETASLGQLCALFNTAFSDYIIPLVLTEQVLEVKLTRDGTQLELSPLAMEGPEPVAFILNGLGDWQGKRTAYNGGTGVVPGARGKALTEQMYHFCFPLLKKQGAEQCLLEVIQENTRAWKIYKRLGFEIVRTFRCFRQATSSLQWHEHQPQEVFFAHVSSPNWPLYQIFWDIEPSWQHHNAAIDRSAGYTKLVEAHASGQCIGYGIVYPTTGAIAQLAVSPGWRGKGVGQALLQQLITLAETPAVTVINVDEKRGQSLIRFLENRKMDETKGQFEMLRAL